MISRKAFLATVPALAVATRADPSSLGLLLREPRTREEWIRREALLGRYEVLSLPPITCALSDHAATEGYRCLREVPGEPWTDPNRLWCFCGGAWGWTDLDDDASWIQAHMDAYDHLGRPWTLKSDREEYCLFRTVHARGRWSSTDLNIVTAPGTWPAIDFSAGRGTHPGLVVRRGSHDEWPFRYYP